MEVSSHVECDLAGVVERPTGESLDNLERNVKADEDQTGKEIRDVILAATVIAALANGTVAQHVALNDRRCCEVHRFVFANSLAIEIPC